MTSPGGFAFADKGQGRAKKLPHFGRHVTEWKERRGASRFTLALPIVVHRIPLRQEADLLYGKTRDISTSGLYFATYEPLELGSKFDLSFGLPFENADDAQILVTAQATVVRVESQPAAVFERVGVAALIDKFQVLRLNQASPK